MGGQQLRDKKRRTSKMSGVPGTVLSAFSTLCHRTLPTALWNWHGDCPYFRDKEDEAQETMSRAESHPVELGFKPTSAWLLTQVHREWGGGGRHDNLVLGICDPRTSRHVAHFSESLLWSHFQRARAWSQLTSHHVLTAAARGNHRRGLCREPPGRQRCDRAQHRPGPAGLGLTLGVPPNFIHSPNSTSSGYCLLAVSSSC